MKKLSYFLMVGLAFTVLQVSTVAAQTGAPVLTIGDPLCQTPPAIGCPPGSPGLTGTNMAPPTTMAPNMGNPNMPPATMAPNMGNPNMPPPTMAPPPGAPHMPPMGDSCMAVPAGPDRDACYSSKSGTMPPMTPPPGAPTQAPLTGAP